MWVVLLLCLCSGVRKTLFAAFPYWWADCQQTTKRFITRSSTELSFWRSIFLVRWRPARQQHDEKTFTISVERHKFRLKSWMNIYPHAFPLLFFSFKSGRARGRANKLSNNFGLASALRAWNDDEQNIFIMSHLMSSWGTENISSGTREWMPEKRGGYETWKNILKSQRSYWNFRSIKFHKLLQKNPVIWLLSTFSQTISKFSYLQSLSGANPFFMYFVAFWISITLPLFMLRRTS